MSMILTFENLHCSGVVGLKSLVGVIRSGVIL